MALNMPEITRKLYIASAINVFKKYSCSQFNIQDMSHVDIDLIKAYCHKISLLDREIHLYKRKTQILERVNFEEKQSAELQDIMDKTIAVFKRIDKNNKKRNSSKLFSKFQKHSEKLIDSKTQEDDISLLMSDINSMPHFYESDSDYCKLRDQHCKEVLKDIITEAFGQDNTFGNKSVNNTIFRAIDEGIANIKLDTIPKLPDIPSSPVTVLE